MKKIVIATMIIGSMVLFADNCDNPKDDFDGLYCLNKIYIQSDKELNSAYKELRSMLSKEGKNILKREQLKWIKQRNNTCSYHDSRGFFVNLKCTTDKTVERTNFLKDRIRECKATGCQESKLTK